MITAFIIITVLYVITFAFFAAVLTCLVLLINKPSKNDNSKKWAKTVKFSEEQAKEIGRRQRELFNFFNYNGDVMPDIDEEQQDK